VLNRTYLVTRGPKDLEHVGFAPQLSAGEMVEMLSLRSSDRFFS
jgi:hypothetical protein